MSQKAPPLPKAMQRAPSPEYVWGGGGPGPRVLPRVRAPKGASSTPAHTGATHPKVLSSMLSMFSIRCDCGSSFLVFGSRPCGRTCGHVKRYAWEQMCSLLCWLVPLPAARPRPGRGSARWGIGALRPILGAHRGVKFTREKQFGRAQRCDVYSEQCAHMCMRESHLDSPRMGQAPTPRRTRQATPLPADGPGAQPNTAHPLLPTPQAFTPSCSPSPEARVLI